MKRARLQKRVAVAAMLGVAGCAALLLHQQAQRPDRDAAPAASMAASAAPAVLPAAAEAAPEVARRVYPYSIVPGGVSDRIELARAVMTDRVVAAHYAGFALDRATLRTVATARAVYVSYRKGDQVYWTARKVTLAEGESVLSDGQNEIRARCGNRISDTPQLPVEAKGPDERELDSYAEQTRDDGDGAVREVAFALDDQYGEGQRFALQSFPNGVGLLVAAQAPADPGQASLDRQFDADRRQALLASLAGPVYDLRDRATGNSATNGGATDTAGEPAAGTGTGGTVTAGSGSGGTSDTAAGGSGGTATGTGTGTDSTTTGSTGADSPGSKPAGGPPAGPPAQIPVPVPGTEPLPSGNLPAKPHELPEPGGLWLTGVAAAVLLLQRRLRPRRPR